MRKRAIEIIKDEKNQPVVVRETKESRQAFVDKYASKNPVKYEVKKEALKKWVASV